jgi:hypothetical protein
VQPCRGTGGKIAGDQARQQCDAGGEHIMFHRIEDGQMVEIGKGVLNSSDASPRVSR